MIDYFINAFIITFFPAISYLLYHVLLTILELNEDNEEDNNG